MKLSRSFLVGRLLCDRLIPAQRNEEQVYKIQNPQRRERLIWGWVVVAWTGEVSAVLRPLPGGMTVCVGIRSFCHF